MRDPDVHEIARCRSGRRAVPVTFVAVLAAVGCQQPKQPTQSVADVWHDSHTAGQTGGGGHADAAAGEKATESNAPIESSAETGESKQAAKRDAPRSKADANDSGDNANKADATSTRRARRDAPQSESTYRPPAVRPSSAEPIAYVNGRPIDRKIVVDVLMAGFGLSVLQQQIVLAAVKQEADRLGIRVRDAEIEQEYDLTIRGSNPSTQGGEITPLRRRELIDLWLKRTGISAEELRTAMIRQAYLRKIASRGLKVSEDQIRAEYDRQFGEMVEIRHIELDSLREADRVRARLNRGEDFALVAAYYSRNRGLASEGGLLPPFSRTDDRIPATLRQAAFSLKDGQTSDPIQFEGAYHLIKLERHIGPSQTPFASVRDRLAHDVEQRLTAMKMDQLAGELLSKAKVSIEDPALRDAYERERAAGRYAGPALRR